MGKRLASRTHRRGLPKTRGPAILPQGFLGVGWRKRVRIQAKAAANLLQRARLNDRAGNASGWHGLDGTRAVEG